MRIVEVKKKRKKIKKVSLSLKLYLVALAVLVLGIMLGMMYFSKLPFSDINHMATNINRFFASYKPDNLTNIDNFLSNTGNNMINIVTIMLATISIYLIPLIIIVIIYTGFLYGFTSSFFISKYGFKGVKFILASYIPSALIYVFVNLTLAVYTVKLLLKRRKLYKNNKKLDKGDITEYSIIIFSSILLLIVGTLIESFITPYIIKIFI